VSYSQEGIFTMKLWSTHQKREALAYDDRGDGPIVVLLHAFPLSRKMFAELPGYRLLTPDLFGFGDSALPVSGWTIDQQADTLAEWLDSVAPTQSVIVGGVSMGGYVALALARRHPLLVRALLLIDTRAEPDSEEAKANRAKSIELVQKEGVAALLQGMLPKILGATTQKIRPEVVETVQKLASQQKPEGVIAALKALRDRPDARASLANIQVPTLVVVGQEDTLTPPDVAQVLKDGIPGAELAILEKVGHLPNLEDSGQFTLSIQRFLQKHFPK
jgi:3-oxoadipate enol-lactonase